MGVNDKIEALRTVRLFASCTKQELRFAASLCDEVKVDEGFVLTTQGGLGRECFVIADGYATVTIDGRVVAEVGPGECVGEVALLDGGHRTATVTAATPMTVYALSPIGFRSLVDTNPVAHTIMKSLARRLRAAETDSPADEPGGPSGT